ncbi:putative RNA methyltransferase [Nitriliruptor alkaliphilus]|uniref:putative RNA methyltransferase n=1 Tax=Nitriliruptor alkaliphilus TaxID=427918 RepID=UPI000698101E|nr:methyltransferase domain-containing protein [Nitriliruptor alkaliphilus]
MHPEVVAALRCPIEGDGFALEGRTLRCPVGHAFDLARQGYVNLVVGRHPGTGDDAAMVAARTAVQGEGRFAAVTDALADLVAELVPPDGVVVDLGAGTGHHLAGVLDRVPDRAGIAVDLSKHAARRAARCHPRVGAVVADVWQDLPIGSGTAAAVLCVFAPRNAAEIVRILRPDGVVVVVTPMRHHLGELIGPLGLLEVDPRKQERLLATLDPVADAVGPVRTVETTWRLDHEQVRALVAMGPSADHLDADDLADRVGRLPAPVRVTLAVELRAYRRR